MSRIVRIVKWLTRTLVDRQRIRRIPNQDWPLIPYKFDLDWYKSIDVQVGPHKGLSCTKARLVDSVCETEKV